MFSLELQWVAEVDIEDPSGQGIPAAPARCRRLAFGFLTSARHAPPPGDGPGAVSSAALWSEAAWAWLAEDFCRSVGQPLEVLRKLLDFLASVGEIDSDSEELSEEAEPTEPNDPLLAICGIAKTTPQMKKPREEQSGTAICKAEAGNPGEESGETSMAAVTPPAWVLRELGILTTQRHGESTTRKKRKEAAAGAAAAGQEERMRSSLQKLEFLRQQVQNMLQHLLQKARGVKTLPDGVVPGQAPGFKGAFLCAQLRLQDGSVCTGPPRKDLSLAKGDLRELSVLQCRRGDKALREELHRRELAAMTALFMSGMAP
eukprot:s1176_g2.t1